MTYLKSKKNWVFHSDFLCLEGGSGEHPPPRHLTYISNPIPNRVKSLNRMISGLINDLQFAYQVNASTQCVLGWFQKPLNTSSKEEVTFMPVVWINRKLSIVYYMVSCSANYYKKVCLPAIFLILMIFVYINQTAAVRWRGKYNFVLLLLWRIFQWTEKTETRMLGMTWEYWVTQMTTFSWAPVLMVCKIWSELVKTFHWIIIHNLQFSTNPDPIKC